MFLGLWGKIIDRLKIMGYVFICLILWLYMRGKSKKGQVWETLIPWIIGIAVLAMVLIVFLILSGKGQGAIEYFKNLVRFGK